MFTIFYAKYYVVQLVWVCTRSFVQYWKLFDIYQILSLNVCGFDVWPSGPFTIYRINTNLDLVFALCWFAKLQAWPKSILFYSQRAAGVFVASKHFSLTWRANDSRVFQFADAIPLVLHSSPVKIVHWRFFTLTKQDCNWSATFSTLLISFCI